MKRLLALMFISIAFVIALTDPPAAGGNTPVPNAAENTPVPNAAENTSVPNAAENTPVPNAGENNTDAGGGNNTIPKVRAGANKTSECDPRSDDTTTTEGTTPNRSLLIEPTQPPEDNSCDCPRYYDPVCANDLVTYRNLCFAKCKMKEKPGVLAILHRGTCREDLVYNLHL